MKIRLAVALVGLAIGFAVPAFAQQRGTADPQIAQQIRALAAKYDEASNRHDAAAVAALYGYYKWVLVSDGNIWKIRRETITESILNSTN